MNQVVPPSKKLKDAVDILNSIDTKDYDRICIALVKNNKLVYRFDIIEEMDMAIRKIKNIMKKRVKRLIYKDFKND